MAKVMPIDSLSGRVIAVLCTGSQARDKDGQQRRRGVKEISSDG
jgi:hypothetical protein